MSKQTRIIFIVVIGISIVVFTFYLYLKSYIPKYRWNENYSYKNDQPYGLKLLFDVLSKSEKKDFIFINRPLRNSLDNNDSASLYLFIGGNYILDSLDSEFLTDFVKKGNTAFISSIEGNHLLYKILTNSDYSCLYLNYYNDSILNINFSDTVQPIHFQFNYKVAKKLVPKEWSGFSEVLMTDTLSSYGFEVISKIDNGDVDCFKVKYGKGCFIFQQNPVLFTNYYISKSQGLEYINKILSGYRKDKIYWDEYSKSPVHLNFEDSNNMSPLRFILSERSLRWSWYLICIFTAVFILFNSKRKQNYIPLITEEKNTTIEYITAIGIIHYKNNSVIYLDDEMMKQFLSFIKQKYGISPQLDKNLLPGILSQKSGISEQEIKRILMLYYDVKYDLDYKYLIKFYESLENFYTKCK